MKKFKEREFQIWGILAIVIIIAWGITVGMLYRSHENSKIDFLNTELERFQGEVNSTLKTYEEFSNYIYDRISLNEEITSIMYQANSASDEEKKVLRESLYNKIYREYPRMQKYRFRQFHFHLPNTESFLRVHLPDKYGDLLIDSRESVRLVNENKTKISGFEEGKIFNGFRNVYPLQHNNEHVGSVEISMSSASVIEILSQLHEKKDFHFIIDKAVVEETLFEDELDNYSDSNIAEDYYVDIEVYEMTAAKNVIIPDSKTKFYENIKHQYKENLKSKESFSLISKFEGKNYLVQFLAIKNFKQRPTAYLISVAESADNWSFIKHMNKEIVLVTLLSIIIIVFALVLAFYQNKLRRSAEIDCLTNIYNRNKFYEITSREIKRARRFEESIAVILMDIDHFKNVNDRYGHEWGDKVLKKLAQEILNSIREIDVFARWGGEEFVLFLPNTDKEGGLIVAEKIRKLIDNSQAKELKDITISIGVALVDSENYDINAAINLADQAMYQAKRNGRNQVRFK